MDILEKILENYNFENIVYYSNHLIKDILSSENIKENDFYKYIYNLELHEKETYLSGYHLRASKISLPNSPINTRFLSIGENGDIKMLFTININRKNLKLQSLSILFFIEDISLEFTIEKANKNIKNFNFFITSKKSAIKVNSNLNDRIIYTLDKKYKYNNDCHSIYDLLDGILLDLNKSKKISEEKIEVFNLIEDNSDIYGLLKIYFINNRVQDLINMIYDTCCSVNKERLNKKLTS